MDHKDTGNNSFKFGRPEIRLGLERMRELAHLLGDPQDKLKFIHVAGTNGKGSACSFICAILAANGYRVGMYTSPAVEDVREQYTINGEWISREAYEDLAARVCAASTGILSEENMKDKDVCPSEDAFLDKMPTVFEYETAMAFLYFYENNCDYVVLETGLGGREDATNIVDTTALTVLTSISEDHLGMIGNSLEEIAHTKAGIIKPGIPVVMTQNPDCVRRVIRDECTKLSAPLYIADDATGITYVTKDEDNPSTGIKLHTPGTYQIQNAALAVKAVEVLREYDKKLRIDDDKLKQAVASTGIPYRMERISDDPLFFLDGAHNPDAALRLRETIEMMFKGYRIIFIMGMFKDKDYRQVVKTMVPLASHIITVQTPDSERALPADELRRCILDESKDTSGDNNIPLDEDDVEALGIGEAVKRSLELAGEYKDQGNKVCIIAFGSLSYLKYIKLQ